METEEDQTTYLAPQMDAIQTVVAKLWSTLQGLAQKHAEFMAHLVTNEPTVRRGQWKLVVRRQRSCRECKLWIRDV